MSHAHRFTGKVVIVTGAAQGIGQGVAQRVAAEGGQRAGRDRLDLVKDTPWPDHCGWRQGGCL